MSGVSRDPFEFLNGPTGDWLPPLNSEQSYNEDDFEVSDPLMSVDLSRETPEVLCALMATSAEGVVHAELVTDAESVPGMSEDMLRVARKGELELEFVCKELQKMTVVPTKIDKTQSKMYQPYSKQTLTFKSIDAEIALQDLEVQNACLQTNLQWVFLNKDITAWAGDYPYVQSLVANGNILLQPRIYRSSEQYQRVMEDLATDVLKAKRLLLEQELDLKQDEKHFFKMAGLKRAAMASNKSLIQYVDNILDGTPALISDITDDELQRSVTREIGSTRCSGHVPVYAGMSYPLPEYMLDYTKADFIAMQKKDSWAQVVARKRTKPVVHTVYIPRYSRDKHVREHVYKQVPKIIESQNEPVMCFAALEDEPDEPDRPSGRR